MNYRCPLDDVLMAKAVAFEEFANGAAQATAKLKDGRIFHGVLVSNGTAIVAVRGFSEPPFEITDIAALYQTAEDTSPAMRGNWQFWDEWR